MGGWSFPYYLVTPLYMELLLPLPLLDCCWVFSRLETLLDVRLVLGLLPNWKRETLEEEVDEEEDEDEEVGVEAESDFFI